MGEAYTVNSESKKESFKEFVDELYTKKPYITFTYQHGKPRTPAQNNAMHVFCEDIAKRCNDAGYWYTVSSQILKGRHRDTVDKGEGQEADVDGCSTSYVP